MVRAREFVKQGIRWKVGNGHTISFWLDSWCHELPLIELFDPDSSGTDRSQVKVNEFITPAKVWDIAKLSQVLPQHLVKLVLAVPIPMTNMEDSFCWGFTGVVISQLNLLLGELMKTSSLIKNPGSLIGCYAKN